MGFSMRLLDLGGGFSKGLTEAFGAVAGAINAALDLHFPLGCGVRIIAEPGRYFAEGAATLAVVVNGTRSQHRAPPGEKKRGWCLWLVVYALCHCGVCLLRWFLDAHHHHASMQEQRVHHRCA